MNAFSNGTTIALFILAACLFVGWHLHWTLFPMKSLTKTSSMFECSALFFVSFPFLRTKPHDDRPNQRTFEALNISRVHQQRLKSFSSLHKHLAGSLSTYRKCYGFMGSEIPTYEQRQRQGQQRQMKSKKRYRFLNALFLKRHINKIQVNFSIVLLLLFFRPEFNCIVSILALDTRALQCQWEAPAMILIK